ncbi:MAG: class 1 fructose-bisphosphatase [Candidatus Altiarchaeota archaeon]
MSEKELITLKDFLKEKVDDDLSALIWEFAAQSVPLREEFPTRRGKAASENIYGEQQIKLDIWTNDFFIDKIGKTGLVGTLLSEESPEPVELGGGPFNITMDPLDGSSNVESNNLFGTIVGIYKNTKIPAKGEKQVAAFYKLYGPITTLVLAVKGKVYEFVKQRKGTVEYVLSKEDLKIPEPKIYGVGGNPDKWIPEFYFFVRLLRNKGLKLRYGGSFVGDFNQVLFHGGFFGYPSFINKPSGKLRLLFEGNPMAYICETAGGGSSTGTRSILKVKPEKLDHRIPIYVGNKELIEELENLFKAAQDARESF